MVFTNTKTGYKPRQPKILSESLKEAQRKIMDVLSLRDHTEKEILKKLKLKFTLDTCEKALIWAKEQNWLPAPEKVQEMVVQSLGRKKKGQNFINQKLKEMGLDKVKIDPEIELEKALEAVETKFEKHLLRGLNFNSAQKEKARVVRFLAGRGFSLEIAQTVLKKFFSTTTNDEESDNDYE